ncbi:MAG: peptidase inhibitor family I36 protein [Saccharothrix sp.]|nr:peptidase inhibitor family I36 protein [Saccharothrix sp.]
MSTALTSVVALLAVVPGILPVTRSASAEAEPAVHGQLAYHHGRAFDISQGWGSARSCVAMPRGMATQCFDSNAEADRYLAESGTTTSAPRGARTTDDPFDCADGWLCLYENRNGEGRRLIFNAEVWHNLANWAFENKASSWRNNQDCDDDGMLGNGDAALDFVLDGCGMAKEMSRDDWAAYVYG